MVGLDRLGAYASRVADASDFETAGVYDPAAADAEDRLALLRWLDGQGFDLEEIAEAAREGKLVTLASRRQLHPGPHHTLKEAAELAGLTVEQFDLVRRSGGLAPA